MSNTAADAAAAAAAVVARAAAAAEVARSRAETTTVSQGTPIDHLLLSAIPALPWPGDHRDVVAVKMRQAWFYDDRSSHIPDSLRGRMRPNLLDDKNYVRLYEGEPGYMFGRNNGEAMVFFFKGATMIIVVIPHRILDVGVPFRSIAEQTAAQFIAPGVPTVAIQSMATDLVYEKLIRTFWVAVRNESAALRSVGLEQQRIDELLAGNNLAYHVDTIIAAFTRAARRVLGNPRFSLRDLLSLPHVSEQWPGNRPCIYVRFYTQPTDQPPGSYREESQSDINEFVGCYAGQTRFPWRRHTMHETMTESPDAQNSPHYSVARKSTADNRHAIPLLVFDQNVPDAVLYMAEQTVILLLRTYRQAMFAEIAHGDMSFFQTLQRKAQLLYSIFGPIRQQLGWPVLRLRGCNHSSPLFETRARILIHQIPMVVGGSSGTRTFTTYRVRRNVVSVRGSSRRGTTSTGRFGIHLIFNNPSNNERVHFTPTFSRETLNIEGPKPEDARSGYLVAEIMDDKGPHPRAWVGVPSVGPYKNFDRASSIALRFEWYDQARRQWYSVYLHRQTHQQARENNHHVVAGNLAWFVNVWRVAMNMVQVFEGIVYQGDLPPGLHRQLVLGDVKILETDHLRQTYRWVPRTHVTLPAPSLATWNDNFRRMFTRFRSDLTLVGPTNPPRMADDIMNRAPRDNRSSVSTEHKCDSCNLFGKGIQCVQDESVTDAWVCKLCSILNRPCTFTAWSELRVLWGSEEPYIRTGVPLSKYPTGPLKFLAYHHTMNPDQLREIRGVVLPLLEKLGESEEALLIDNEDGAEVQVEREVGRVDRDFDAE
ncbi:uncharacterized protein FTJAE_14158 [Fusarium tjaetaba]|uniref:Uncharacterized protein n=1 Tax=Fusarium tjaetaba TaxID=1567544 RepID=A0A8H5V860_9HYPO|nr:uncharacterized protein FTJAE_14158 [Fusarium tjaetaba]KAF5611779.1 hypothetical protein FTJAE_14158 [Fusarium tjaetaba]